MTRLLLVRHAHAGDRGAWVGDDAARPLSARGRAQAAGLPDLLGHLLMPASQVVVASSPALRCTDTVAPLAATLGTAVTVDAALAEGARVRDLRPRLDALSGPTVWCSHGDLIPGLLMLLADEGLDLGPDPRCRKGSTWVLDLVDGTARAARYLPPPEPAPAG